MKVSLNWLNDYVDLPADAEKLSDLLTFAGVEVEGIDNRNPDFAHVVVGQVLSSDPHPDADRLSVCKVEVGEDEPVQIVCGAKNYKVGDKVAVALPGAVLPGDFKIKKGKLRGVASAGMMCSAKELQLAEDADGLMILPADKEVGLPIAEAIKGDIIFDLEITPNRPDQLSHIGLAREAAALLGKPLSVPEVSNANSGADEATVEVKITAPDACPYYTARRINGVKIGPSPEWLVEKLEAVGIRTINNVVDITNFVMMEMGQPLHAFDAAKVNGAITARLASEAETFLALDGETYTLAADQLVIADDKGAVALAGIMGGELSGVTEGTTEIVLESAFFQTSGIRRTGRELGLHSDSSYRFERGVDPAGVVVASDRATQLILEIAGGELSGGLAEAGIVDCGSWDVTLRYDNCRSLIGVEIPMDRIDGILSGFGLVKASGDETSAAWTVPSFRGDLSREVDLIEEVARVYGIDNVPTRMVGRFTEQSAEDKSYDFRMKVSRALAGLGFFEAKTLSLVPEGILQDDLFVTGEVMRIRNPLGEDSAALRPSLLPGLLQSLALNARKGAGTVRLFEVGHTFAGGNARQEETLRVAMVATGAVGARSWGDAHPAMMDFFYLKGIVESIGIPRLRFRSVESDRVALCTEVLSGKLQIGFIGQVLPARARELDIETPVLVAELNLETLEQLSSDKLKFTDIARFPSTSRDMAMLVPQELGHADIEAVLGKAKEALLSEVEIFDVFTDPTGEKVPVGSKSVAYSLTYRSSERTLGTEEVNDAHDRLKQKLSAELSVRFRE